MNLACYIVDDEPHAVAVLNDLIIKTPGLTLVGQATLPQAALMELTTSAPDLLFLDVDMPGLSGLELAKLVPATTSIIFTTAYREYAPEAFDREAVDYLLKPIAYDRFLQAIQKVRKQTSAPQVPSVIYVKTGIKGTLERVDLPAIQYISGSLNYIEIHLRDKKIITYLTLSEILDRLPETGFSRIHKSTIVNHDYIRTLEPARIKLFDGTELAVGRSYQDTFREQMKGKIVLSKRSN